MTAINVPPEVLEKAMRVSHNASAEQVVVRALEEYARRHSQAELVKHLGTFEECMTLDELSKMRGTLAMTENSHETP